MNEEIGISVIVPVYNVELYLDECLNSVIGQSFANYEIVCIDDASTDNSKHILHHYKSKCEKINIVSHSTNRGLSAARNSGMEVARGKYILFLDSDDLLSSKDTLRELWTCAEEYRLDIVYFNMIKRYDQESTEVLDIEEEKKNRIYSGQELFCEFALARYYKIEAWRQFFRRQFLKYNEICFYEGILHEDNLFSFFCAMKAERVMDVSKTYYIYRQRKNSIMSTQNEHHAQSVYVVLSEIYSYWSSHSFPEEVNRAIAKYFEMLHRIYKYYRNFGIENSEMKCGGYAARYVYNLMQGENRPFFSAEHVAKIAEADMLILYGAGPVAVDLIYFLRNYRIKIEYITVTNREQNPEQLFGIEVKEVTELLDYREKATVVLGVKKHHVRDIKDNLEKLGFQKVITIKEDWE